MSRIKDIFTIPAFMRGYGQKYQAKELDTIVLVEELMRRGVTEVELAGMCFAIQAQADGRDWQYNGTGEEGQHGKKAVPF